MSNFSDLYAKIRTTIPTLTGFTTKTEIPNPYPDGLSSNNELLTRDGWGLKVGPSSPQDTTYKLQDYVQTQEFEIILTRAVPTTASNPDPIVTQVTAIRNDINTIAKDFTTNRFTIADKVEEININSITGIETVSVGKSKHLTASIIFEFLQWR